ncbi:HAD-IIIA family hydrolase [Parafrankia sp. FMc6]|uniref:D-glycero-alpha-D-manno-heptose-1,7-bisphosphate 7-phosphatase n=1 Tax=Parafrankia soli TaxID=2599596 RepID=UPI0034D47BF1
MELGVRLPRHYRLELVVLDRDGVLNRNLDRGVRQSSDWVWLPGARAAANCLFAHDIRLMVATNQANIGRGIMTTEQLAAIHGRMVDELRPAHVRLTDVLHCPHLPDDRCFCRKPEPGLVHAAMRASGVDAERTLLIGDQMSDIAAAGAAGCWSLHVRSGRGGPPTGPRPRYLGSVANLLTAARILTATS